MTNDSTPQKLASVYLVRASGYYSEDTVFCDGCSERMDKEGSLMLSTYNENTYWHARCLAQLAATLKALMAQAAKSDRLVAQDLNEKAAELDRLRDTIEVE